MVHAGFDFFDGRVGRSGGCERGGGRVFAVVVVVVVVVVVEGGDFGFGQEPLFFETDFAAAFVAVPKYEEEDCGGGEVSTA